MVAWFLVVGFLTTAAGVAMKGWAGAVLLTCGAVLALVPLMISEYRRSRKH